MLQDIRALLSVLIIIGGAVLLKLDGPLVDQFGREIVYGMGAIVAYWFGAAAFMPRQPGESTSSTTTTTTQGEPPPCPISTSSGR